MRKSKDELKNRAIARAINKFNRIVDNHNKRYVTEPDFRKMVNGRQRFMEERGLKITWQDRQELKGKEPKWAQFTPAGSVLLTTKCNGLWNIYLTPSGAVLLVIGETIWQTEKDPKVMKRIAWKEGSQWHCKRDKSDMHRNSKTYGFARMFIDYLHAAGQPLYINRKVYTLENFNSFEVRTQGAFEQQYMVPEDLLRI